MRHSYACFVTCDCRSRATEDQSVYSRHPMDQSNLCTIGSSTAENTMFAIDTVIVWMWLSKVHKLLPIKTLVASGYTRKPRFSESPSFIPLRVKWLFGRRTILLVHTWRMPVQRAALCIRNFPSQYRTHFRGLSGHNAGRFNATVFISMLSGSELAFPLIARQPLTRHC